MKLNSSHKDIELPLLSGQNKSSSAGHFLESQNPTSGKYKYLDISVVNRMLFSWVTSIIHVIRYIFQQDQHYGLREDEDTYCISEKISLEWEDLKGKNLSLFRAQFRTFKSLVILSQVLAAIQTLFDFTGPVMVAQIITYISKPEQTLSEALLLIFGFIMSRVGIIIISAQCMLTTVR